ncbi:transmembrane protein 144-like [Anneissia japonica]|uniref:transmembrane protein 144-like n=1 Tax=Anneissia japonica TaxID=1529436 RepID=UPI001425ADEC|nr:transmembrane protein 144-like [Anneissia japonica]
MADMVEYSDSNNITTVGWTTDRSVPSDIIGYIASTIAVVFFGANLVPVKKADTGDGMFYQWIACSSTWLIGLIVHLIRGCPPFKPLAMLGGLLWATGHITVVPILKTIGISLGFMIWDSTNLLAGWASGRFGLFGLHKDVITRPVCSYLGVAFSLLRAFMLMFVEENVSAENVPSDDESSVLLKERQRRASTQVTAAEPECSVGAASWVDNLSPIYKRVVGICLSLIAGIFYGLNFVPCIWIQQNVEGSSSNGLDYVFSHYCGIYLTSSIYFFLYCVLKRNQPQLPPGLILPSMAAGVMWGIAQSGWFVANDILSTSVSFPIVTAGPTLIALLWGVFYFHEITGLKNYILLAVITVIIIAGTILTALARL